MAGDLWDTARFVDSVRLPYIAPSLGGVETLIEQPTVISYWDQARPCLACHCGQHLSEGLLSASVNGMEHQGTVLWACADRALDVRAGLLIASVETLELHRCRALMQRGVQ